MNHWGDISAAWGDRPSLAHQRNIKVPYSTLHHGQPTNQTLVAMILLYSPSQLGYNSSV